MINKRRVKRGRKKRKHTTITIPKLLYKKLEEKIKNTGFASVSGYVTYVMREIVSSEHETEEAFTKEDEERVKERLRALGYI